MRILHGLIFLLIFGVVFCKESEDDGDTAAAFIEAAKSLFADNKDTLGGLRGAASAFAQSDSGKQVTKKKLIINLKPPKKHSLFKQNNFSDDG